MEPAIQEVRQLTATVPEEEELGCDVQRRENRVIPLNGSRVAASELPKLLIYKGRHRAHMVWIPIALQCVATTENLNLNHWHESLPRFLDLPAAARPGLGVFPTRRP